jgi:hypothetical protein
VKKPLYRHKEDLLNHKRYLNEVKKDLDKLQAHYDDCLRSTMFYMEQVETAEKEGKFEFDRNRYLKSRRK